MMTLRPLLLILALLIFAASPATAQFAGVQFAASVRQCPDNSTELADIDFSADSCSDVLIDDLNPQGDTIWVQARLDSAVFANPDRPQAVLVYAMASSDVYWNGELLGSNGRPGRTAAEEVAGQMDIEFFLPSALIREGENLLTLRMSSHNGLIHARRPVHMIAVASHGLAKPRALRYYLPTLIAAGALLVAIGYFGLAYLSDRRQIAALLLAGLASFALVQAWAESARVFYAYDYPLHVPRLILVGLLSWCIAICLTALITVRFRISHARYYILAAAGLGLLIAPFAPGFDGKSLTALLIGMGVSVLALARPAWQGDRAARITTVVLLGFIALIFYRNASLLDRDLFLAITALCGVLFADQILSMRRDRRAREAADRRSARLELELVRRGIAPHFLMNTLNSLTEWVESDPQTGVRMIHALGEQMRGLAGISDRELIPLTQELDLVRSYLTVMSYRTDSPFDLETGPYPPGLSIPPGVLHTLTENAFSHNRFPRGGVFLLEIEEEADRIRLTFETPEPHSRREKVSQGQGHAYVRGRLRDAFGDRADFEAYALENGAWHSRLDIPAGGAEPAR